MFTLSWFAKANQASYRSRSGLAFSSPRGTLAVLGVAFIAACAVSGAPQKKDPPPQQGKAITGVPAAPDSKAEYAGSEACGTCHDDIFKTFQKNPHHQVESDKKRGWEGRACETCHGPGSIHVESASPADIINPAKVEPVRADGICLTCHLNEPNQAGRHRSEHARNQVTCMGCHSVHKGPEALYPRRSAQVNQICANCHLPEWTDFQKPHTHPLTAGAMSCSDCHNPHGSFRPRSVRAVSANEPACFRCHGNLRGPFPFPHAPVRTSECTTCHEPHGSVNPRMMIRAEVRFLCLECHSNIGVTNAIGGIPPAFHDLRSPRYRNCTICHTRIHGSYVDPGLQR